MSTWSGDDPTDAERAALHAESPPTDGATTAGEPPPRDPDALDELCDAIARFGEAQFALGSSDLKSAFASIDQAKVAHDSLWRVIVRIIEGCAQEMSGLRSQLAEREQQLATAKRNEALMTERYDFWLNIARGAAEECGLPLDGPATDLRPAIMALRAALAEAQRDGERLDFLGAEATHDHAGALFRCNRPITRHAIDLARSPSQPEPQ